MPAVDLTKIPAQRYQMTAIYLQAALQETMEKLEESGACAIAEHDKQVREMSLQQK